MTRALAEHGVDVEAMLREQEFTPGAERMSLAQASTLWSMAVSRSGSAAIGVEAAQTVRDGDYGVLEYAVRASSTLRAALERVARLHLLLNDHVRVVLRDSGDETAMSYDCRGLEQVMGAPYVEFVVTGWVQAATRLIGRAPPLRAVCFAHAAPADTRRHRAVFGDLLGFEAPETQLVFDREQLAQALPTADPGVAAVIDRHAEQVIASLAKSAQWTRRALDVVEARLPDGPPRLVDVAEELGVSEGALRRRLRDEGTTFTQLVDDLRRRRAEEMVADPALSLAEIAFLLGFSESSAFYRAFRRWTGHTPRGADVE
ncbi:AraC family transcriptional regulator [Haliangium sp.]|uniref:AraC family transcriptional regulator n=1 Tax=Haliangium sp. TaxID=2663208 RepID=UPI003D0B561B